jgi:HK97 family phage major capsid protein/HK97 family phage prohead protease
MPITQSTAAPIPDVDLTLDGQGDEQQPMRQGEVRRAYALLHIKAIDPTRRIVTGVATTPEADRDGDIVEPLGVTFKNPLPFLFHHRSDQPIGTVVFDPPTADGITFTASLPTITEPGALKNRIDEAWQSVKAGLIAGVSIGFRELAGGVEVLKSGGLRFLKIEVYELSLVTVPANAGATIRTIKALDLAASGRHLPGGTGPIAIVRGQKAARPMTIQEQITGLEHKRAADFARLTEIQTKATAEGNTKDGAEREEFDTLKLTIKTIDAELVDLHDLEKLAMATATPIKPVTAIEKAAALRGGTPVIHVSSQLPKGTAFTRMCIAMFRGKADSYQTLQHAKSFRDTPEVEQMVQFMWDQKAAVAPGTTTDATWAGPLAVRTAINEFLELLRPRTLLGQVSGFKQVPFNVSVPSQTAGGTYSWVGQGLAKPVTSAAYAAVTLDFAKAAGIIVISEELAKLSTPSAEGLVREELIAGMGAFLDVQLVDPAVAVGANLNPASITNGAATIVASGVTGAAAKLDLASRVAVFTAANIPLLGSVWLMSDSNAFGLGLSVNALGQPLFPGLSIAGGSILGIPVIVSNNVGNRIILVHAPSILYADEGGVQIDVSREATIQMDGAPDSPATATTVLVSLWQNNLVGLRAERMITWKRARAAAVTYISAAAYVGT